MQLLVQLGQLLPLAANFAHGMQNGGVIAPAEQFSDFRKAFLCQLFGQVHRNLTGPGNAGRPLLGVHVCDLDFVIVRHGFLDIFHRNLAVLDGQQVTQGFTGQKDRDVFLVKA